MYVFVCVGGTDTEEESAHKVDSTEENSPAAPAGIRIRNHSITSPVPVLSTTSYSGVQRFRQNKLTGGLKHDTGIIQVKESIFFRAGKFHLNRCKARVLDARSPYCKFVGIVEISGLLRRF